MRLVDQIISLCQEPNQEAKDLRERVVSLEHQVNLQKQTIDQLLARVEQLESQLDTRPASVTVVTTVANKGTTVAVVIMVANTSTGSSTSTTTTPAHAQQHQRASYLDAYRSWMRQACLVVISAFFCITVVSVDVTRSIASFIIISVSLIAHCC